MIEPTPEMIEYSDQRTRKHIARVARNLRLLASQSENASELEQRAESHDASKFGAIEHIPYVWLTEFHRCRRSGEPFQYPDGVEVEVRKAIDHHLTSNRHHPEFHDKPDDMTEVDLIEMVCDWTAMSQEFQQDGGSARGWAKKTIGTRVSFCAEKVQFIFKTIDRLDRLIEETGEPIK